MSKVIFVLIKNKEVIHVESATPKNEGDIERRFNMIHFEECDKAKAIFGDGHVWDFILPMTSDDIKKQAGKLFLSIQS